MSMPRDHSLTRFTPAEARDVDDAIATTIQDSGTFARDLRTTGLIAPTRQRRSDTADAPLRSTPPRSTP